MESFFLSETVKYLFLLFSNATALPDHYVMSTEVGGWVDGWFGGVGCVGRQSWMGDKPAAWGLPPVPGAGAWWWA